MKKIVIGIDISKEKIDASAIDVRNDCPGLVKLDYQVFENRPAGFRRMLVWARRLIKSVTLEEVMFCCETTGGYDRCLCDYMFAKDLDIWREGALQIKKSMGLRKGKDDRADSLAIAEYAMRHMDKAEYYESPSGTVRELKALLLYRRKLEQEMTSKKVRAAELKATAPRSKSVSFILRDAQKGIRALEKSIRECERQILALYEEDGELKRSYGHLTSIKGIGIVNATAMIAYTNNFRNIRTGRKLASYYGVAPFREQSGSSIDRRAYVKCYSNSMLKAYLNQAACCAVMQQGVFHEYYARMSGKGKCHSVILNNVKNKLLHLAVSLIGNDTDYEENHEFVRTQKKQHSA